MAAQAHIIQTTQKLHQGPIPSPEVLRDYDLVVAGAAERIIAMAEQQSHHRQQLEARSLESDIEAQRKKSQTEQMSVSGPITNERIGLVLGFIVAAGCVTAAAVGMARGAPPLTIGLFLSLPVAGIIKAFLPRKS
jgi:uncharacterized membrane protein